MIDGGIKSELKSTNSFSINLPFFNWTKFNCCIVAAMSWGSMPVDSLIAENKISTIEAQMCMAMRHWITSQVIVLS